MMNCHCPEHRTAPPPGVAFVTVETAVGPVTRTSALTDGRVLCQICFDYTWPCGLHEDESGVLTDICKTCQVTEQYIVDNTFVCPRCKSRSTNPQDKLYQYCRKCHDWTGDIEPHEICVIHQRYEPESANSYKCCIECGHVWPTEQEFIDDVQRARADHAAGMLRYEGIELPPDTSDPRGESICPLCTSSF